MLCFGLCFVVQLSEKSSRVDSINSTSNEITPPPENINFKLKLLFFNLLISIAKNSSIVDFFFTFIFWALPLSTFLKTRSDLTLQLSLNTHCSAYSHIKRLKIQANVLIFNRNLISCAMIIAS